MTRRYELRWHYLDSGPWRVLGAFDTQRDAENAMVSDVSCGGSGTWRVVQVDERLVDEYKRT